MSHDQKSLWDDLKADLNTSPKPLSPDMLKRIDAALAPVDALRKAFEHERERQPFVSQAPCPICGTGTVTYWYKEPLYGGMKCDTPECISSHF